MDAIIAGSLIGAGANIGKGLLQSATGLANAQNSDSTSHSENVARQSGASSAESAGSSYGYSNADNWSDSWGEERGESSSWSESNESASSTTYGREASAEAKERAAEANAINYNLWKAQADYNAAEAQKVRDYETMMANTSYQRAVQDLKKAGLNPILAAGNMGAATPTVTAASSGLATSHMANTFAQTESRSSGSSRSGSYSYNYGNSRSHSEGHSRSESSSNEYSKSNSWNRGYEKGTSDSNSKTRTQLMDLIGTMGDMINGNTSGQKTHSGGGAGHKF